MDGLKNLDDFQIGDLVYVYQSLYRLSCGYQFNDLLSHGHGVVICVGKDDPYSTKYLESMQMISILVNGKVGLYQQNEVVRINSRHAGTDSERSGHCN